MAKRTAAATSAAPVHRAISRGRRSTAAVPHGSGVVVVGVLGGDHLAPEPGSHAAIVSLGWPIAPWSV